MSDPLDHPDLRDPAWARRIERRARRDARNSKLRRALSHGRHWRPTRRTKAVTVVIAIVALTAGGVYAVEQSTANHTSSRLEHDAPVDLAHPYRGTPAATWEDGAAGIVLPEPEPVGEFTSSEVGQMLDQVKQVLVAARLDRTTLTGNSDLQSMAHLLSDRQRADLHKQLRGDRWPIDYATRIADDFDLLPAGPRVTGSMEFEAGRSGELLVHTNYVVAYAFDSERPEELASPLDIVAVGRWKQTFIVRSGQSFAPEVRGISYGTGRGHLYAIACSTLAKGLLAPAYSDPRYVDNPDDRSAESYFDPSQPIPRTSSCPTQA